MPTVYTQSAFSAYRAKLEPSVIARAVTHDADTRTSAITVVSCYGYSSKARTDWPASWPVRLPAATAESVARGLFEAAMVDLTLMHLQALGAESTIVVDMDS